MRYWLAFLVVGVALTLVCGGYEPIQAQSGDLKPTFR
jgi:hypothetical protein